VSAPVYFPAFQDAAGVGQVGLDDVHDSLLKDALEVPPGVEPFSGGDGGGGVGGDFPEGFVVFRQYRLLYEHEVQGIEFFR
jgi:hypothetical protein